MTKTIVYIYISVLSLCGMARIYAQDTSVLASLCDRMNSSCVQIEYDWQATASGTKIAGEGEVTVQGNAYSMKGDGLEIRCDGKTLWTVDTAGKEIVVEPASSAADGYMNNPALLFLNLYKVFDVSETGRTSQGITYSLSPKMSCGIASGSVTISSDGSVIRSGTFTLDDGNVLTVMVTSMKRLPQQPVTVFYLDMSVYDSSWLVTELR